MLYLEPAEYKFDSQIPFVPDGVSPVTGSVEEVVRSRDHLYKLARKTILKRAPLGVWAESWRTNAKQMLVQEAFMIQRARHHHVIQLIDVYFDDQNQRTDEIRFAIVMDRADSNLRHYLQPKKCPDIRWFGCLSQAVCYLHASHILHGAIKPENILIKGGQVLLTDFGLSQRGLGEMVKGRSQWNPVYEYCAPELRDKGISKETDVFSLGAVFLEMLIALDYSDKFETLKSILKRPCPSDGILSYANNIHQVHSWIEEELDGLGWHEKKIRSKCKEMIQPNPIQRSSIEDSDDFSPSLSAEYRYCTCVYVGA